VIPSGRSPCESGHSETAENLITSVKQRSAFAFTLQGPGPGGTGLHWISPGSSGSGPAFHTPISCRLSQSDQRSSKRQPTPQRTTARLERRVPPPYLGEWHVTIWSNMCRVNACHIVIWSAEFASLFFTSECLGRTIREDVFRPHHYCLFLCA
jgi:hypothetical protein